MDLLAKIRMSSKFGKVTYIVSSLITMTMSLIVLLDPFFTGVMLLLKVVSIPIICYLQASLTKSESIYFYLNLGISRKEYHIIPVAVEFLAFILLSTAATIIGYGNA